MVALEIQELQEILANQATLVKMVALGKKVQTVPMVNQESRGTLDLL